MFKDIFTLFRINHYIKNLVIFIPLLFSKNIYDFKLFSLTLISFLAFSLAASAVYIFNDIIDRNKDRKHPLKKYRPIASGEISLRTAIIFCILLLVLSLRICSFSETVFLIISSYFVLNIFYSLYLKNIPLIDALCIAIFFIQRILAGCAAINVEPSPLVIIMTFFISMFFTSIKRKKELQLNINTNSTRPSLCGYNIDFLNQSILANAILSIAFYFTYVLDPITINRFGSEYLYITVIPFSLMIFRLLFIINSSCTDDPLHFIQKDKIIHILVVLYCLTIFGLILF